MCWCFSYVFFVFLYARSQRDREKNTELENVDSGRNEETIIVNLSYQSLYYIESTIIRCFFNLYGSISYVDVQQIIIVLII